MAQRLAGWNSDVGWNGFTTRTTVYDDSGTYLVMIRLLDQKKKSIASKRYRNIKTEDAICIFYNEYLIPYLWN